VETRDQFWERHIRCRAMARLVVEVSVAFACIAYLLIRGADEFVAVILGMTLTSLAFTHGGPASAIANALTEWAKTRRALAPPTRPDRDLRAS
jgi:hypothetical protein